MNEYVAQLNVQILQDVALTVSGEVVCFYSSFLCGSSLNETVKELLKSHTCTNKWHVFMDHRVYGLSVMQLSPIMAFNVQLSFSTEFYTGPICG